MTVNFKFENLPINIYKEGEMYVVVCHLLDISGYGNTIDHAKESFGIIFEETMNYLIENNLLMKDLEEHGFRFEDHSIYPPTDYSLIGQENMNMELMV
jgi:hypothetical protein